MAPIALGSKHQDLPKAYLEVSKSEKPDWISIAHKAGFKTDKYARDQFAIVKKKLLAAPNGEPIELSDNHSTLLQTVVGALKADVDWDKVATVAKFKTAKYARDQWAIVRKKFGGASTASAAATPTSSKATPSCKRKKAESKHYYTTGNDGDYDANIHVDNEAGEEQYTPGDEDETPSKKPKTPKTPKTPKSPKWKKTQAKEAMKKVKTEVEESEAEADAEAEVEESNSEQARQTPGLQAEVDEQIKTEMHEDMDAQFADADMFRMD